MNMASIQSGTDPRMMPTGESGKVLPIKRTGTSSGNFRENREQAEDIAAAGEENEYLRREGDIVDNNQILEKYIDKVDRDQAALREDLRESERRIAEHSSATEERMDARLNRIEDMITKSNERLDQQITSIENKIDSVDSKIDSKLEAFRGELREHKFFRASMTIAIVGVCLATIIGIAAMV